MKTLLILAHPYYEQNSRIHKRLIESLPENHQQLTVHMLHQHYIKNQQILPIDVEREQKLLVSHDKIIIQYPVYWYMPPAILKHWLDEVLLYNFAYGRSGTQLKNKEVQLMLTFGQKEHTFHKDFKNRFSVEDFIKPMEQTLYICQMKMLPPFYIFNTDHLKDNEFQIIITNYMKLVNINNR